MIDYTPSVAIDSPLAGDIAYALSCAAAEFRALGVHGPNGLDKALVEWRAVWDARRYPWTVDEVAS